MKNLMNVSMVIVSSILALGLVNSLTAQSYQEISSQTISVGADKSQNLPTQGQQVAQASPATHATQPSKGPTPLLSQTDPYQFLDPVPVGKKAPDFTTKDAKGKVIKLSQFVGKKNVVMVFYSGSKCPVCGRQLENIQSHLKDFMTQDAEILAISADDVLHANRTLGEHGLSFSVIPDQNKEIIKKFGITNIQHNGGAYPSCFIIDKQGMVRLSFADPDGKRLHSNELLPELAKITKKPAPALGYDD